MLPTGRERGKDQSRQSPESPRANRENPGKNRESPKMDKKGQKRKDKSRLAKTPRLMKPPCLVALEFSIATTQSQNTSAGQVSIFLAHRLGGEVETHQCIWFSRPNIWLKKAHGLAHQTTLFCEKESPATLENGLV